MLKLVVLAKDKTIIETTSGNTSIGLAAIAAAKGYKLRIYMQDGVSEEQTKVVKRNGGCTIFRCSRNGSYL